MRRQKASTTKDTIRVPLCEPSCPLWLMIALDVLPEFRARIFGIQLCQFAQNFLRTLVARHGDSGLDFDDLISACALLGGRWNALLAQPKLLARLGSRRNLEHRAAIDGRNFNLCAERRFANAHRNG